MSLALFEGGGGTSVEEASLFSSGMEMTVDDDAASTAPIDDRSKLASDTTAGGVIAFSLDDVVASSSSIEGQDGVDSSILLKRSFNACKETE